MDMLNADRSSTQCNGNLGVDPPSPLPRDPPDPTPDPQFPLPSSHHRLSIQSVTSLTSSRPAPPSPAMSRRASGLSRTSSRPVSGVSLTTPSRPISGVQHSRPVSGSESRPPSITMQPITPITTTTPVTTTPRQPDRRPNRVSTSSLDPTPAEPTPTSTQATATITAPLTTTTCLIQIRDYGFAPTDPRFSGQGPHVPCANRPAFLARRLAATSKSTPSPSSEGDDEDDDEGDDDEEDEDEEAEGERMNIDVVPRMWENVGDGTNGWNGLKWGFPHAWGFGRTSVASDTPAGFPSRGDLDRNFGGEDEYEEMDMDVDMDDEGDRVEIEGDPEGDPPLFPGLYRALYAFEPEGIAEMKLDEDQLVRVIGRGGGVGWAVVVKDGLKDMGVHALVPESYLEAVRLDGEDA